MTLTPGARFGPYEVIAHIGAGGMGEVYRARDTRLKREIALKVLPEAFASDPDRLARFEREATTLAALNHPHIAQIYGFEQSEGLGALVMELVDGEDLSERIARGALPLEAALPIARGIAEALEAAHEAGIVHRDLKPANIKVRDDGLVKVLDFGLAKALEPAALAASATQSPTLTSPALATGAGMLLGTAAYMSPEQAKGKAADKRSDIWAFGCVLYEMLTGRRAFGGDDVADTLAAVLRGEPDWSVMPPAVPPLLGRLVRRCLEKDRRQRIGDVAALRFALSEADALPGGSARPQPASKPSWRRLVAVSAATVLAGAMGVAAGWRLNGSPRPVVTRFTFTLGEGQRFTNTGRHAVALSPDGTQIVYVANLQLYLKRSPELEARPIPGTVTPNGLTSPVFSPDGQSVAFVELGSLKRIAVGGGTPVTLAELGGAVFGMSWDDETILVGLGERGIVRVPATGGTPETVVAMNDGELAHGPQLLPGGRAVLFTLATGTAENRWERATIVAHTLASGDRKTLIDSGTDARYLATGHLVFARGGILYGAAFDASRLEVIGTPVALVEGVRRSLVATNTGAAHYHVSRSGSLAYIPGAVSVALRRLVFVDAAGGLHPLDLPDRDYVHPRVSPDGKRLAFGTQTDTEAVIWTYDMAAASPARRLTLQAKNRFPIWTPDGTRIAFQSDREGDLGIFWQRADGTGTPERLTKADADTAHVPHSWSPNGRRLLYDVVTDSSIVLRALDRQQKTSATILSSGPGGFLRAVDLTNATFSPDGRWIAYYSRNPDPRGTVFVQPFPPTGEQHHVPISGAAFPMWMPDGKALVVRMPAEVRWVTVGITTQATGTVAFGNPRSEYAVGPLTAGTGGGRSPRNWDLAPDGRLIGVVDAADAQPQIHVVLNWLEELKGRVPVK